MRNANLKREGKNIAPFLNEICGFFFGKKEVWNVN